MSRTLATVAQHLLLSLLLLSLIGVAGCGGGAGKDDDEDLPPDPPATLTLSGTVLGNDGAPIADALITARLGDGSNAVLDTGTSAADGAYTVDLPEATAFYLHVAKAAYASTNSHIREITTTKVGVDLVLLLQVQADSLLMVLGGPAQLTPANLLFLVQAVDPSGMELAGVNVNVTPIGLLLLYRLTDDTGYTLTGPTVACTNMAGCALPQMAGYSAADKQGVSTFRLSQVGGGTLATVAAPLIPAEVTFVVND